MINLYTIIERQKIKNNSCDTLQFLLRLRACNLHSHELAFSSDTCSVEELTQPSRRKLRYRHLKFVFYFGCLIRSLLSLPQHFFLPMPVSEIREQSLGRFLQICEHSPWENRLFKPKASYDFPTDISRAANQEICHSSATDLGCRTVKKLYGRSQMLL